MKFNKMPSTNHMKKLLPKKKSPHFGAPKTELLPAEAEGFRPIVETINNVAPILTFFCSLLLTAFASAEVKQGAKVNMRGFPILFAIHQYRYTYEGDNSFLFLSMRLLGVVPK